MQPLTPIRMTSWYHADVKPARPGVYQVQCGHAVWYSHWNGEFWSVGTADRHTVPFVCGVRSDIQAKVWRGLVQEVA